MKKVALAACLGLLLFASHESSVYSHCEIPCGIYGDVTRISLLYENIATVEKSMSQITALTKEKPANVNQVIRWVNNKEKHCDEIQHIVTQYFMTQRIKPKAESDGKAHAKYLAQLTTLHQMLIHAMKSKQTTDVAHVKHLRDAVQRLSGLYFSKEDLEHIKGHHPEGK